MKIERFKYGMFNGKILLEKTDGLNAVLSDQNFQRLRNLTEEDSDQYLWLPSEQLIAFPHIIVVEDKDGRTFVQNKTLLIGIHDYIHLTDPAQLLSRFFKGGWNSNPERLEPIKI